MQSSLSACSVGTIALCLAGLFCRKMLTDCVFAIF